MEFEWLLCFEFVVLPVASYIYSPFLFMYLFTAMAESVILVATLMTSCYLESYAHYN